VYKVKRLSDGQLYALKKVKIQNLSDREKENALNEVRILASIKNPFVAAYKEAFFDEPSNSLWYVPHASCLSVCLSVCVLYALFVCDAAL